MGGFETVCKNNRTLFRYILKCGSVLLLYYSRNLSTISNTCYTFNRSLQLPCSYWLAYTNRNSMEVHSAPVVISHNHTHTRASSRHFPLKIKLIRRESFVFVRQASLISLPLRSLCWCWCTDRNYGDMQQADRPSPTSLSRYHNRSRLQLHSPNAMEKGTPDIFRSSRVMKMSNRKMKGFSYRVHLLQSI